MSNQVNLSTTGTPATVTIDDLGGITFVHPVVNEPLVSPDGFLDYETVLESLETGDLGAAETAGEVILTDASGNTISPGSDALTFVSLTQTETIQGTKTFNSDRIIIDPTDTGTTTQFQIGWFNDLTPADPNSFGFRRVDTGGVISWMNNANFPQIFAGSPTGTGETFIDATNNRPLNINVLDTGVDDPGRVTIGIGGLTIEGSSEISPTNPLSVFRNDALPVLSFEVESDGTITAGVTTAYETLVTADNDIPNRKWVLDQLAQVGGGAGGASSGFIEYKFDNSTSMSNPGSGEFRFNNSTPASVTAIAISDESETGGDISGLLGFLSPGNFVYIQEIEDAGAFLIAEVVSTVDNGSWWQLNVTISDSGTLPDDGKECGVNFLYVGLGSIGIDQSDPTGTTNRTQSTIAFNELTREFSITPTGASFSYYIKGQKYEITSALTTIIPDVTGAVFIYLDSDQTLKQLTAFDPALFSELAFIAEIYWNSTQAKAVLFADERHGITMDGATHQHFHEAFGCQYYEGFDLTNGTDTVSLTGGTIADEDLIFNIVDTATPTADFEQELSPIAQLPILYRLGAEEWNSDPANGLLVKQVSTVPQYNLDTAGNYSLQDVPNLDYFVYWVFATNDIRHPVQLIMGTSASSNLDKIKLVNTFASLGITTIPTPEYKLLYRVILQRDDTEANNYLIIEAEDLRWVVDERLKNGGSVPVEDHGTLSGLADDDHVQYFNQARGDARYYTQTQVDALLANLDLASVQIRRTTQLNPIPLTWTDYDFDVTDVESDDSIIEHNDTNRDDIDIKADGLYFIYANITADDECQVRFRVDDTTVIPGSTQEAGDVTDAAQIIAQVNPGVLYQATAGEKITMQIQARTGAEFTLVDSTLVIIKLDGIPGGAGPTGATGATGDTGFGIYAWADVTGTTGVENDGVGLSVVRNSVGSYTYTFDVPVASATYSVNGQLYNLGVNTDTNIFVDNRTTTGFDLSIGTGDNGTTADVLVDVDHTVTVLGPNSGAPASPDQPSIIRVESTGADQVANYNTATPEIALVLTGAVTTIGDGATDYSNVNGTITTNFNGHVRAYFNVPHTSTGARVSIKSVIQQDTGGGFVNVSAGDHSYIRNNGGHDSDTNTITDVFPCSVGDQFRVGMRRSENSTVGAAANLLPNTVFILEKIK